MFQATVFSFACAPLEEDGSVFAMLEIAAIARLSSFRLLHGRS
jgi:hypothetical protein